MRIQWIVILALVLAACGARDTGLPLDKATSSASNAYATALSAPKTNTTAVTKVPPSNGVTATAAPRVNVTESAATPVRLPTTVITVTSKPRPQPTATASGPLTFIGSGIYVSSCRHAPTTDKPSHIIIQISLEVTGSNGDYQYFDNDGKHWLTKFIDVAGDTGTAVIGKVTITSGDGQTISKEYYIQPSELTCS